ncbi:MAG: hypothetical protein HRT68_06780, partial [Flavobacteriaceae bacterium]|nr:hypothetical protein [Flavobacteriaceae bacterium]
MRKYLAVIALFFALITQVGHAQEASYAVGDETYILKTAVEGELSLLWNTIDNEFRYFVKKGDEIYELKNTKDDDGKYQEEYKETLRFLTGDSSLIPSDTDLTLSSLKYYVNSYNKEKDPSYEYNVSAVKLKTRLGLFGGVSNNPFVNNPENELAPIFGAEFEIYEDETAKRHSGFFEFKQSLKSGDFDYQSTQISLNYRFRFIYTPSFNVYAQAKFATYTRASNTFTIVDETTGLLTTVKESAGNFDTPFAFGLGADIKLFNESYLTLTYGEIVSVFLDSNGNFPMDFRIGYKFKL